MYAIRSYYVFPAQRGKELQLVRMQVAGKESVVIEHLVHEASRRDFVIRETVTAAETGGIISLLTRERFQIPTGEELRYLGMFDAGQHIVGGLIFAAPEDAEAELKAVVIDESLDRRKMPGSNQKKAVPTNTSRQFFCARVSGPVAPFSVFAASSREIRAALTESL